MEFDFTVSVGTLAVTAQLICGFVFAFAKIRFSLDVAHIIPFTNHQVLLSNQDSLVSVCSIMINTSVS